MNPSLSPSTFAEHSLAAFVAPLIESRRVAVVGPSSGPLAERVRSLGAKSVVAIGGSSDHVPVRPMSIGVIEAFRGRIDCVLIADASSINFVKMLDEARRALGHDGVLIVATPAKRSKNSPDYHTLRSALTERFEQVHLLGRGAFVGYTIASLEQSPDDITLDTSLMPEDPEAAEAFVGIASDSEFSIDPLAIVQVPLFDLVGRAPEVAPVNAEIEAEKNALAERIQKSTAELEQARAALAQAEKAGVQARKRQTELERSLDEGAAQEAQLRATLEKAESLKSKLEAELTKLKKEAIEREKNVGTEIGLLEKTLGQRGREKDELLKQIAMRDDAVRELTFQFDQARNGAVEEELQAARARNAELASLHAAVGVEANRLAAQNDVLRERVAQLQALIEAREAEIKQLEFMKNNAARLPAPVVSSAPAVDEAAIRAEISKEFASEMSKLRADYESKLANAKSALAQATKAARSEIEAELALEHAEQAARAARARDESDAEAARLRAESETQRRRADDAENALNRTLFQLRSLEASESDARARVASAETRLQDALTKLNAGVSTDAVAASLVDRSKLDELERLLRESDRRASVLEAELTATQGELQEALDTRGEAMAQVDESRTELSRQLALNASIDDRVAQLTQELEGVRKGYTRRTRELEREVEQLVRALEVATSHAGEDGEGVEALQKEIASISAERDGLTMRLDDLEAAYQALVHAQHPSTNPPPPESGERENLDFSQPNPSESRAEQLLATLAETAARLAATEESLAEEQSQSRQLDEQLRDARQELLALKDRNASRAAAETTAGVDVSVMEREASEREMLVRSLVAQLEDRDLRLRALERRLVEEVERARRTESEIWELELRARDQRIVLLQREAERHSSRPPPSVAEPQTLAALDDARQSLDSARAKMENVRAGISAILVEGRGAAVAHELVSLLRSLDDQSHS